MQDFLNKKILLGVCGGVAIYKSAYLIRGLKALGAEVQVVMTQSAKAFVSPALLQALSGKAVREDLFDAAAEAAMSHIELARWADYLLIAPASANFLAKMAQGIADDLLSTLYLVAEVPVIVCPAMNKSMWAHPATVDNCALLKQRGVRFIGPEAGIQACGETGFGRVSEADMIIQVLRLPALQGLLAGKKVVITAGPTREALDPVRFLSNHSSGKMAYALALAALMAGAEVILVSGPTDLDKPWGVKQLQVESAQEMLEGVLSELSQGCIFIGAAAVADYRPAKVIQHKIKKKDQDELSLQLVKNVDILQTVAKSGKASYVVGFAAETEGLIPQAREKLEKKQIDMIIANQVGPQLGFNQEANQVSIITKNEQIDLSMMHKTALAGEIIAILSANLQNKIP